MNNFFYQKGNISTVFSARTSTRLVKYASRTLAIVRSHESNASLLNTDPMQTLVVTTAGAKRISFNFTPFGYADGIERSPVGFCGERPDELLGWYPLGNGHRWYSPTLMRFGSPDGESPFLVGGISYYAYALNNPITLSDPDGRAPFESLAAQNRALVTYKHLKPLYRFDDQLGVYHSKSGFFKKRKLLIYTHGAEGKLLVQGEKVGPEQFSEWLKTNAIDTARYREVIFMACLSGYSTPGTRSFAEAFSNINNVNTRGVDGIGVSGYQDLGNKATVRLLAASALGDSASTTAAAGIPFAQGMNRFKPQKHTSIRSSK